MVSSAWMNRPGKPSGNSLPVLAFSGLTHLLTLLTCFPPDVYKLTSELLGEGAYAKVQGAVSLQTGKEYAVKVSVPLGPISTFKRSFLVQHGSPERKVGGRTYLHSLNSNLGFST